MKAVVYKEPKKVAVEEVDDPKIEESTDVIVKLTSSSICSSDLQIYDGLTFPESGQILGHETMGVVHEAGDSVKLVETGDRVVMPFNISYGVCLNCAQSLTNTCLKTNPEIPGASYGYIEMGDYNGGQAEYIRVPYADWACLKLPGEPGDEFENDFVLLSDIFPTAYHSTELADVKTGKSVAVFGSGPVGLLAAYSSIIKGASEVYCVDHSKERLKKAESIGAIPINFENGDPSKQIMDMRKENCNLKESLRPGYEKALGVDCAIDAVGYQALDRNDPNKQRGNQVLLDIANVINAGGAIGIIGDYPKENPSANNTNEKHGHMILPWGKLLSKSVKIGTGQKSLKKLHIHLRNLIFNGKAKPSFVISDRIEIDDAPQIYSEFNNADVVKPVINFI